MIVINYCDTIIGAMEAITNNLDYDIEIEGRFPKLALTINFSITAVVVVGSACAW